MIKSYVLISLSMTDRKSKRSVSRLGVMIETYGREDRADNLDTICTIEFDSLAQVHRVFFVNWGILSIFIYSEMRTCLFGFSYALIIAEDSLLADFHNFNGSSVECTSGKPKWEGQIIEGSSGAALEGVRVPFEEGIVLRSVVGQGSWGVVYTDDDRFAIKVDMRNTRAGWEDRRNATMVMSLMTPL